MTDPFTILLTATFRPNQFSLALMERRYMLRATLAAVLWTTVAACFLGVILAQIMVIPERMLLAGTALAFVPGLFTAGLGIALGRTRQTISTLANVMFWLLRPQFTVTPWLIVALPIALTLLSRGQGGQYIDATILGGLMWALGALVTLILIKHPRRSEAGVVRWLLTGTVVISGVQWQLFAIHHVDNQIVIWMVAGALLGLLWPATGLVEMVVSLVWAVYVRQWGGAARVLHYHPVFHNELSILPLPGLTGLVLAACEDDLERSRPWLLTLAEHPGQHEVAGQVVNRLATRGPLGVRILFWLSCQPDGRKLLGRLIASGRTVNPLVEAYVALCTVDEPGAWALTIRQHWHVLDAHPSGNQPILALLAAGAGVLDSYEWPDAVRVLRAISVDPQQEPWGVALEIVQSTISHIDPLWLDHRTLFLDRLLVELDDLTGWPADLLLAMCEQLAFLLRLEAMKGAMIA